MLRDELTLEFVWRIRWGDLVKNCNKLVGCVVLFIYFSLYYKYRVRYLFLSIHVEKSNIQV